MFENKNMVYGAKVFESTALSNLRNYSMFISGFHHHFMSGSLMRLE